VDLVSESETSSHSGEDSTSSSDDGNNDNLAIRDVASPRISTTKTNRGLVTDSDDDSNSDNASDYTNSNSSSTEEDEENFDDWNTPMEDQEMSKARTIYVYRNQYDIQSAIKQHDPIASIGIKGDNDKPILYALYHKLKRGNLGG
jgi:hypothetical protein